MGGPTFSFWYAEFTDASCARLAAIASSLARSFHERARQPARRDRRVFDAELVIETPAIAASGTIGLFVDRRANDCYPAFVQAAFEAELGFVPLFELGGYCMANQPGDWDALRLLAQHVVAAFGGLIVSPAQGTALPDLPRGVSLLDPAVREIVARDEARYFGAMASDLDYVRRYRDCVPVERYWVIDAAVAPTAWVGK